MIRFTDRQITKFLRALDSQLTGSFEVEIIGGAAAAIAFHVRTNTEDIDTITSVVDIEDALAAARIATGFDIPFGVAGIWDGPYEYRSRRKRVRIKGVRRLSMYVPEKHDWALMKIIRLKDKDRDHILRVKRKVGFSRRTFLKRFLSEMTHVMGNPRDLVYNFLAMMEELFGPKEALRMTEAIEKHKNWKSILSL